MRVFSFLPPYLRQYLWFGLRVGVLGALLAYVVTRVGYRQLQDDLSRANWTLILLGVLFLSAQIPIAAWRWTIILRALGFRMPITLAMRLVVSGLFLSQVLPGAVAGDAVRVWLTMKTGCKLKDAVNSVALDRVIMLSALFLLASLAMLGIGDLPPLLQKRWLAVSLVCGTLSMIVLLMLADRLPTFLQRWRIFRAASYLAIDARSVLLCRPVVTALLILSVGSYLNMSVSMYTLAVAVGQSVDFWLFTLCSLPVILVSILPISIGGWGTREVAAVGLLASIGVAPSSAILISVLFGAGTIFVSLPGALFVFLDSRVKPNATDSATVEKR